MKIKRPYLRFITAEEPTGDAGESGAAEPGATPVPPTEDEKAKGDETTSEPDLGDSGKKAIQAERDARKTAEKTATDALAKVKAFEDAQKTQSEKDAEARAELEKSNTENAAKVLRYEAAEKTGLPLAAAARLQGATLEDLIADAEVLKGLGVGTEPPKPGTPRPDKTQAATGGKTVPKTLQDAVGSHYAD